MKTLFGLQTIQTLFFVLAFLPFSVLGQEGHPLDGTWSGDRIVNGDKVRVLLIMKLLPDQRIEGTLIENGVRLVLDNVVLDPADWSVNISVDGKARSGELVRYAVEGMIENLGSKSDRWLVGTWHGDGETGEFRVKMN